MFNGQAPLAQRFSPLQRRSSRLHQFPPSRAASPSPAPRPGGVGRRPACGIQRWPAAGAGRLGHALARRAAGRMRADPSTGWARWSVAKAVCIPYTYCLPRQRFRSYAVISRASDKPPGVARPWPGGEKRRSGRASHHEAGAAIGSFPLPCAATRVSLLAVWCLISATLRCQPWTSAVTLPHGRHGRSARRMAVVWTCREPLLRRHVRRACMRNAVRDCTPILPATACHQRHDVETYSRFNLRAWV
jgi:hypothetical protein